MYPPGAIFKKYRIWGIFHMSVHIFFKNIIFCRIQAAALGTLPPAGQDFMRLRHPCIGLLYGVTDNFIFVGLVSVTGTGSML